MLGFAPTRYREVVLTVSKNESHEPAKVCSVCGGKSKLARAKPLTKTRWDHE